MIWCIWYFNHDQNRVDSLKFATLSIRLSLWAGYYVSYKFREMESDHVDLDFHSQISSCCIARLTDVSYLQMFIDRIRNLHTQAVVLKSAEALEQLNDLIILRVNSSQQLSILQSIQARTMTVLCANDLKSDQNLRHFHFLSSWKRDDRLRCTKQEQSWASLKMIYEIPFADWKYIIALSTSLFYGFLSSEHCNANLIQLLYWSGKNHRHSSYTLCVLVSHIPHSASFFIRFW